MILSAHATSSAITPRDRNPSGLYPISLKIVRMRLAINLFNGAPLPVPELRTLNFSDL